jgi:hypothetical protein
MLPRRPLKAASDIVGSKVHNFQEEALGHIEDLAVDMQTGIIRYAVLSFGGFLGIGDKLFAVPWISMRFDPVKEIFYLDAYKDRMEKAPGFDRDHWPNMDDREWGERVHQHYGASPWWQST